MHITDVLKKDTIAHLWRSSRPPRASTRVRHSSHARSSCAVPVSRRRCACGLHLGLGNCAHQASHMTFGGFPLLVATLLVSSTAFLTPPPRSTSFLSAPSVLPCLGAAPFSGGSGQESDDQMLVLRQARHTSRVSGCSRLVRAMSQSGEHLVRPSNAEE